MSDPALKRTPLEEEHRALGAKIGEFAGWAMPIEYEGTLSEHRAVRERVGLFDLSHLGKVDVEGPDALATLQRVLTGDLAKVVWGRALYNLVLNDQGGIVEDLIAYRLGGERFFVVPNAANTDRVVRLLIDERRGSGASVVSHEDWCFLAVQGPRAVEVVGAIFPEAADLSFMGCTESEYRGRRLVLSRSGYTGELGFELFVPADVALALWRELMDAGEPFTIEACGLGARDVLRLEMGYPLYGQDLTEERTPLQAGLDWTVSFDKGEFPGRGALQKRKELGIPDRLWGLRMADRRHIPRPHYRVLARDELLGEVTSGTFSPTLGRGIALAYLAPPERLWAGMEVEVDVRGRRGRATLVKPPFVDRSPR